MLVWKRHTQTGEVRNVVWYRLQVRSTYKQLQRANGVGFGATTESEHRIVEWFLMVTLSWLGQEDLCAGPVGNSEVMADSSAQRLHRVHVSNVH